MELKRWEEMKTNIKKAQAYLVHLLEVVCSGENNNVVSEEENFMSEPSSPELYQEPAISEIDDPNIEEEDEESVDNAAIVIDNKVVPVLVNPDFTSEPGLVQFSVVDEAQTMTEPVSNNNTTEPSDTENTFTCSVCGMSFSNNIILQRHYKIYHVKTPKSYQTRVETMYTVKQLKKRPVTPTYPYKCGLCPEKFQLGNEFEAHVFDHFESNKYIRQYPCAHCNILFRKRGEILKHQDEHIKNPHKKLGFSCDKCQKRFLTIQNLRLHMIVHQDNYDFSCAACPAVFKTKNLLLKHLLSHHKTRPKNIIKITDTTNVMDSSNDSQNTIVYDEWETEISMNPQQSLGIDMPETDAFPFTLSDSENITAVDPKIISRVSTQVHLVKCGVCNITFENVPRLTSHLLNVHKPNSGNYSSYPCGICNATFKLIDLLIIHVQQHAESEEEAMANLIKPSSFEKYSCQLCDPQVSFNMLVDLEVHLKNQHPSLDYEAISITENQPPDEDAIKSSTIPSYSIISSNDVGGPLGKIPLHFLEDNSSNMSKIFFCESCNIDLQNYESYEIHMALDLETYKMVSCTICQAQFKKIEVLMSHIKKHLHNPDVDISLKCDKCDKRFHDEHNLLTHQRTHSEHRRFKCIACDISYKSKHSFTRHYNIHHTDYTGSLDDLVLDIPEPGSSKAKIKVDSIAVSQTTWEYIQKHKKSQLPSEIEFGCGLCYSLFEDADDFRSHITSEYNQLKRKRIPCYICGAEFRKVDPLVKHMIEHIANPIKKTLFECEICKKSFHLYNSYVSHLKIHDEKKRFQCKLCDACFTYKISWKLHINKHHPEMGADESEGLIDTKKRDEEAQSGSQSSKVPPPGPSFVVIPTNNSSESTSEQVADTDDQNESNITEFNVDDIVMIAVEDEESGQKSQQEEVITKVVHNDPYYLCMICYKKFDKPCLLHEHMLQDHITEDQVDCPYCEEHLTTPEILNDHLKTKHATTKRYFCPICDKHFIRRDSVNKHLLVHSTERTFQCDLCENNYRNFSALCQHKKRTHLKLYNYLCNVCSRRFISKAELRRHVKRHTGSHLKHDCEICGKGFEIISLLNSHMISHTKERPHRCMKCSKGFASLKSLRNHMRNVCKLPEEEIVYSRPRFLIKANTK
jgi:KRAB domain-containing zinc finger protein